MNSIDLFNEGLSAYQNGDLVHAEHTLLTLIQQDSMFYDALHILAVIYASQGEHDRATYFYSKTFDVNPNDPTLLSNWASSLVELNQNSRALALLKKAVDLEPDSPEFLYNLANCYCGLGEFLNAIPLYKRVIDLEPTSHTSLNNLGKALFDLSQFNESAIYFHSALEIFPDSPDYLMNYANALNKLNRFNEALFLFDKVLTLNPNNAEAWLNKGNSFLRMGKIKNAIVFFDKAISLRPTYIEALLSKASAFQDLENYLQAISCYQQALSFNQNNIWATVNLIYSKLKICSWGSLNSLTRSISKNVLTNREIVHPFPLLALVDDPRLHQIAAKIYLNYAIPVVMENQVPGHQNLKPKIKIGYFSCDFYNHATAYLMADFFESHDHSLFETIAFSYGPPTQDVMRQRLQSSFDQFIEVAHLDDRQIANLSKELGIDIAVDLKGFTQGSRLGIFAQRAAPIQVSYLGYPGTLGAEFMDYIIADHALICEENQPFFTEKIIYLPNSYQVNDRQRVISPKAYSRADFGLPTDQFVFCCFNNNYKILPAMFDEWMQLLQAVDHSVLWLFKDNDSAQQNLILEAQQRGVAAQRLIFAERMDHAEHLARLRLADLFLDTFPYNAHTTGSDALWVGLPVLTLAGKSFASRVGASLLRALDLPELIANSMDQYRSIALQLANDSAKMSRLRHKLAEAITTKPLFDTPQITSHIEKAFLTIYERYMRQQAPEHIDLSLRS